MPSRLNAVAETKYTGVVWVRKNRRISGIPRSVSVATCDIDVLPFGCPRYY